MDKYVERVRNLVRVVAAVPDDKFDLRRWWDPVNHCGCAIGHAMQDNYFIRQGIGDTRGPDSINEMAKFFDISPARAIELFVVSMKYGNRQEVITALRVLLMEKEAALVAASPERTVELLADDVKNDIAHAHEDVLCR
jgi:hypothetical protein